MAFKANPFIVIRAAVQTLEVVGTAKIPRVACWAETFVDLAGPRPVVADYHLAFATERGSIFITADVGWDTRATAPLLLRAALALRHAVLGALFLLGAALVRRDACPIGALPLLGTALVLGNARIFATLLVRAALVDWSAGSIGATSPTGPGAEVLATNLLLLWLLVMLVLVLMLLAALARGLHVV
jgi:hypothetical protein